VALFCRTLRTRHPITRVHWSIH